MDGTTHEVCFSNADLIRRRWAAMGFQRSEAAVQAAAKAMDEEEARCLKQQAQAKSPEDDIDEAWNQSRQERETQNEPGNNLEDTFQSLLDEYCSEPTVAAAPEAEAEPTPQPAADAKRVATSPVVKAIETDLNPVLDSVTSQSKIDTAVRQRGRRQPTPARKLPHGGCTGVWIPREVYEDPRFQSFNEMILYLEVNHLDQEDGCTAKNQHFADYLGCSTQTIQDMIRDTTKKEIFACVYPSRTSRIIHVAGGRKSYPRHRG
jgi:hypothetical protein